MKLDFLNRFEFFAGVPDSLLSPVCSYLISKYGIGKQHLIAANEGNAVALAAGYHLSTGKIPVVYMQNSGEGNIVNPVASLLNDKVYAIPCVFLVGWRGEPGVHDEPQHIFQGEITVKLLEDLDIASMVITKSTTEDEVLKQLDEWQPLLDKGKQVAFVVEKGALEFDGKTKYANSYSMKREEIIRHITMISGDNPIVSTTGKASRELFEIRECANQNHSRDFLTVGSMGHSSSIALEIALQKPDKTVWIIDGDGAVLMHMGAMALIGANKPENLIHVVINNCAHESVGGMPTVAGEINLAAIATACGYPKATTVSNFDELYKALIDAKASKVLTFIEVKAAIGARADLGRPTTTARENKEAFMHSLLNN